MNESSSDLPRSQRGVPMTENARREPVWRGRRPAAALAVLAGLSLLLAGCKVPNLGDGSPPGQGTGPAGGFPLSTVVLSPGGKTMAFVDVRSSSSYLTRVRVSDVATGRLITTVTDRRGIDGAALSPGGTILATLNVGGSTDLRDAATGRLIATLADPDHVGGERGQTVAFSPDGKMLAVADVGGGIALWNVASRHLAGSFTYPGSGSGDILGIAFSPDGNTLAIFDDNNHTYLTSVPGGREIAALTDPYMSGGPAAVAFSPDGKSLATGQSDGTTYLWDIATGTRTAVLTDHRGDIEAVAYSPDGRTLATGDGNGHLYLWNTATWHLIDAWTIPRGPAIETLAFSADGTTITAGYGNGHARQWNLG